MSDGKCQDEEHRQENNYTRTLIPSVTVIHTDLKKREPIPELWS